MRHLSDALDHVRRDEYKRLQGKDRRYIKGQRYTLLSHRENLTLDARQALKQLLAANKRLKTTYLLQERPDERRVREECVITCRAQWSPYHSNTNTTTLPSHHRS